MTESRRRFRSERVGARRRLVTIVLVSVLAVVGTGSVVAWSLYEDKVRQILGLPASNDFSGEGTLPEVTIVIAEGDFGDAVAQQLVDKGVTKSFDAVYSILLADASVTFTPGTYVLKTGMSARAALDVLTDPANRVTDTVTIPEGTVLPNVLKLLSEATGVPLAEFESAAAEYTSLGVPSIAPSLEGYLFPATYSFDDGLTAHDYLQVLVDEMFDRLSALGVQPDQVNVKAKTAEKLGPVGMGQSMEARAVVLLKKA